MNLVVNLLLAVLTFCAVDFILARMGLVDPAKVLLAVLLAIVVFFANFASYLH